MSAGWLRLDSLAPRSAKVASLGNDALRWLWIVTLCEAKLQKPSGRFGSRAHWQAVTGGKPAAFKALLDAGLLHEAPELCGACEDGAGAQPHGIVVVHDWHAFQVDPSTERVRRFRQRIEQQSAPAPELPRDTRLYRTQTGTESIGSIVKRVAKGVER
jgi:hypothetical protein